MLDSTDPDQVRAALGDRLDRTVVVVSSKSGGTVETDSQRRAYEQAFTDAGHRRRPRASSSSPTPARPRKRPGTRATAVFLADPDVGGRYSALTAFGLVPSGLAGADIADLLDEAEAVCRLLADGRRGQPRPAARRRAGRHAAPARQGRPGRPRLRASSGSPTGPSS